MINLREHLRAVIQQGVAGWIDACFSGDYQPVDSITGYPLTRETALVMYKSDAPYKAIEDAFVAFTYSDTPITPKLIQAWISYHWQHAKLELAENFGYVSLPMTDDMEARREQLRGELVGQGYTRRFSG